jgi:hypothetical protein
MSKHHKIVAVIVLFIGLLILFTLMATAISAQETKTAYTRDDIHFISKERVDENIRYEYAKPGEYREVQVPLDTVVVGASAIPQNISTPKEKEETVPEEKSPSSSSSDQTTPSASEDKYPYAPLFIGLLAIGGLVFFVASVFSGRERQ